jgi:hypothetical protein
MSDLSPVCDQKRTSTTRNKFHRLNSILALQLLTSVTRWSAAVAAPLRSIFAIVSATRQTALSFRDRLIASGGFRTNADAAQHYQAASCVSGRLVQRTSESRGWLGADFFLSAIY